MATTSSVEALNSWNVLLRSQSRQEIVFFIAKMEAVVIVLKPRTMKINFSNKKAK